jgi:glucose-1-phosphate cytidylyltransferase
MKTVILCGGRGTRLNELGLAVPKALVPIGGKPVIWHLMRLYTSFGFDEFVLCLGYLQNQIRSFFGGDQALDDEFVKIDLNGLKCKVRLVDTGQDTNTGGRLKTVESLFGEGERFFLTYGDGMSDIDLASLLQFHIDQGKTATLTAVHPVSNFGILKLRDDSSVADFNEKPVLDDWINGGFFVFERGIFNLLEDNSVLEQDPLTSLAETGELMAYKHTGFWKCMDTHKDNAEMNQLWESHAPWKVW